MKLRCLFSKEQIARRVKQLAETISHDYRNKDELFVICILNGSIFFSADLVRELKIPCIFNCIKAKSYAGTTSTGKVDISYGDSLDVNGKDVLIIEDIVDTGTTLKALIDFYTAKGAASIKVCSFLDKQCRRTADVKVDYYGFEIDDKFVVGYGMDYNEKYRELPYIGYIE